MQSKKLFTVLALCAVVLHLGAVSVQAEELKIWMLTASNDKVNEVWKDMAKAFEATHPGVTVSITGRSIDEHKSALRVAAQSNKGPDIYFMWAGLGLGGEFVKAGLSKPLDKYYKKYDWDKRLVSSAISFSKIYEGGRHGVPYTFRGEGIYYNKALFKKAGITTLPKNYAELKADAAKLKKAGIPAFTFGGSVNWHLMRLMDVILETKCGAEKHGQLKAMDLDWSNEACVGASFTELSDWTRNYILSPFMGIDQAQSFNLFIANRAAMMLEGDWLVDQLRTAGRLEGFSSFPFPTGTNRLYGFAEYFYVSSKSKVPDLAAEFLDYMVSDQVQQDNLGTFGTISVNANVKYKNVDAADQEWIDIFNEYSEIFMNGDQAFPLDVTTEYFRVINEVASKNIKPEDAGKTLQTFISNKK
jgi:raffinose/stachyose/melibiose transport system substrate-binding protein